MNTSKTKNGLNTHKDLHSYAAIIQDACGCSATECEAVEDFIRDNMSPTLDHLTRTELGKLAVRAYAIMCKQTRKI